jgi:hypothetical protein
MMFCSTVSFPTDASCARYPMPMRALLNIGTSVIPSLLS